MKNLTLLKTHIFAFVTFLFLVFATLLLTSSASAQETPQDTARKYNISFPVAELGNCSNVAECRTYCQDPVNQNACIAFAKAKGFYKEELNQRQQELLNTARSELGCTDIARCQALCHQQENFEKCNTFARKYGVSGGHTEDPAKQEILEKAQQVLSCTSYQDCKSFCEQEQNREKCHSFAQQVGLRGGEQKVGPGGCTSEETCKAFCSDPNNFQVCASYSKGHGGGFRGPGGCSSEESCRRYCLENPNNCGLVRFGVSPPAFNPQEVCLRTPSCRWENNTCQCGLNNPEEAKRVSEKYTEYCQTNPQRCQPGQSASFSSHTERERFEEYCRKFPERCKTDFIRDDRVEQCFRSGKYWYNNTCNEKSESGGYPYPTGDYPRPSQPSDNKCPDGYFIGPGGYCIQKKDVIPYTSFPQPTYQKISCPPGQYKGPGGYCIFSATSGNEGASGGGYSPEVECKKNSNCRWESNSCQCSSASGSSGSGTVPTSPPQTNSAEQECKSRSGCRWEDNTCKCESSSGSGGFSESGGSSGTSGNSEQMEACFRQSGCRWEDNTCKCGGVQGVSSEEPNFIEFIIRNLFNLFR